MAPKKRKAAAEASAKSSKKKQKTIPTPVADHSKCKSHADVDQRKTRCSGIRGDGERCSTKIKAKPSEAAFTAGCMPVCGVHKSQKLVLGRCVAIADCGYKCDRFIVVSTAKSQLCKAHYVEDNTCHLYKLPPELRQMIIDKLIPDQPKLKAIPARWVGPLERQKYKDAAALLRVSKQISADTSVLLFEANNYACEIEICPEAVRLLGQEFKHNIHEPRQKKEAILSSPIAKFGVYNITRFCNYKVKIDFGGSVEETDLFYRLLENVQRVLYAIQPLSYASADTDLDENSEAQAPEEDEIAISPTKTIEFSMKYQTRLIKSGRWNYSQSNPHPAEVMAMAKAVRSAWMNAQIDADEVKWTLEILYKSGPQYEAERFMYKTSFEKKYVAKGEGPRKSWEGAFKDSMKSWRSMKELDVLHPIRQSRVQRWHLFEKICLLATAFSGLDVAESSGRFEKSLYAYFGTVAPYNNDAERMMASARYAHESGDVETLELLFDDLQVLWEKYRTGLIQGADDAVSNVVNQPSVNMMGSITARKLLSARRQERLTWPAIRVGPSFAADDLVENDGVYRFAGDEDYTIYQRIHPVHALQVIREDQEKSEKGEKAKRARASSS